MKTAIKSNSRKSSSSESIISDATQQFPEAASVGDAFRQGDIYITRLEGVPKNCKADETPVAQLAPGNTQGSRHCLRSLRGAKVYTISNPTVYDGPVLELTKVNEITHPEHGNVKLPIGCYAISYQRTEDSEGRQRRVQD